MRIIDRILEQRLEELNNIDRQNAIWVQKRKLAK